MVTKSNVHHRVMRKPLDLTAVPNDPLVFHAKVSKSIFIGDREWDFSNHGSIDNLSEILFTLKRMAEQTRHPRSYVHLVRHYFDYLRDIGGAITASTLRGYREQLNIDPGKGANSKAQEFGHVLRFTKALIDAKNIEYFDLPKNLQHEAKTPIHNFYDLAPQSFEDLSSQQIALCQAFEKEFALDTVSSVCASLSYDWMLRIERIAKQEIEDIYNDYMYAKNVIANAKQDGRYKKYESICDYRDIHSKDLDDLIIWSHSRYGISIPSASKPEHDECFYHYVKRFHGGYTRFRRLFFPSLESLTPFLILFLCNRQCSPNVDGVFSYTYRGCVTKGSQPECNGITFGKYRGASKTITKDVERGKKDDWTLPNALIFLHKYSDPKDMGVRIDNNIYDGDRVRLFISYERTKGEIRNMDPSSMSYTVSRFMKAAAEDDPLLEPLSSVVTGQNFRPTHLLLERLCGADLFQIQRIAEHKNITTTAQYTERQVAITKGRSSMRNFQEYMYKQILSRKDERLGNGIVCDSRDEDCKLDSCLTCENKKIVLNNIEITAEWLAWVDHIRSNESQIRKNNNKRWEQKWAIHIEMYSVFIDKVSPVVVRKAKELLDKKSFNLPPIY